LCLCRSWLAISQNAISGAEQNAKAYWRRVTIDYHERQHLKPFKIQIDHGFKRDGPSSNFRPASCAAPLRMSNANPKAAPAWSTWYVPYVIWAN
jgi:hypothetical protein